MIQGRESDAVPMGYQDAVIIVGVAFAIAAVKIVRIICNHRLDMRRQKDLADITR